MKQLACEMCGSTNLIKQDGVFVCQSCGCKYSVEEAKKMMVEGTVNVQGTVTVDNSSFVEKSLQNARRAKAKEDWEETEKYYNKVEEYDPSNIEAVFYSAYGKAMQSLIDENFFKREAVFKVFRNVISMIDDNYTLENEVEEKQLIKQISDDITKMVNYEFVYNTWKTSDYNEFTEEYEYTTHTNKNKTIQLFNDVEIEFISSIDNIISSLYTIEKKEYIITYRKIMIKHTESLINGSTSKYTQNEYKEKLKNLHMMLKALDPTHVIPLSLENSKSSSKQAKKNNVLCILGFAFSLCSIIFPFLAIIGILLSIIGLVKFNKNNEKGKGFGIAGLLIGIFLFTVYSGI